MSRGRLRPSPLGALAAAGLVAAAALIATGADRASAAGGTVVQAEGDAFALDATTSLAGSPLVHAGPESPALASVPPQAAQSSSAALTDCSGGTGTGCTDPLVSALDVVQSNADAGIQGGVTAHCEGAPAGVGGNTVVGGSACVTIAATGLLNTGAADAISATGVTALSQTQGCDDNGFTGTARIKSLVVDGTEVVAPDPLETTPAPNTVVSLGAITVILNEQHFDAHGHGLTVNAVHVFTSADLGQLAGADVIVGHAHSQAMCDTGTVSTPPPNVGPNGQSLPVGTKSDSTKSADPGEVVTYTLSIATNGCSVVSLVDTLPSGFRYVDGSAHGDLGTAPAVTTADGGAVQQLAWSMPAGWSAAVLTETLQATVPAAAAPGTYVNTAAGDATPPLTDRSIGCGSFAFSDTEPLNGPVAADNGSNPGIVVPRATAGAPAVRPNNLPGTVPEAAAPPTTVGTPNTAAAAPASGAGAAALALLTLGAAVARRRR